MTCRICGKPVRLPHKHYCDFDCALFAKAVQDSPATYPVRILQSVKEYDHTALETSRKAVQTLIHFGLIEQPDWLQGTRRYRISQQGVQFLEWVEGL